MENYFEAGLDTLKQKLLTMASHAETAVNEAVQALVQRDIDLALRVRKTTASLTSLKSRLTTSSSSF